MNMFGTLTCGGSGVASQHVARTPSGQLHQIRFSSSLCQPFVREGVAELMRMDSFNSCFTGPAPQHLRDARVGEMPLLAQPQPRPVAILVTCPLAQIAVERLDSVSPHGECTVPPPLAADVQLIEVDVNVHIDPQSRDLANRAPVSMNTNMMAVSLRSSNERLEQASKSLRISESAMSGMELSLSLGGRMWAIGCCGISPSSTSHPKSCFRSR